jgi:BirA family biotin operon repressor/biotin-[acetyl-CoA-carboxylase] ligase
VKEVGLSTQSSEKQVEPISPQTLFTGQQVIWLPECGSTNTEARELLVQNRATDGCTVITDCQTAGRGQRGNQWEAAPGENLTLSVVWRPTFLPATAQFRLNLAVALGVHDWAAALLGPDPALRLKWPNDLFYQDQKLGGILIENTLSGAQIHSSVVGIGLNINQTEFGVPTATSLSRLTGRAYALAPLITRLLESLERRYLQLRAGQHEALRADYRRVLYRYDDWHPFEVSGQRLTGRITDVTETGLLLLQLGDGQLRAFDLQEIRHVLNG